MKNYLFLTILAPLICTTVTGQTIDAVSRTIYGAIASTTYASQIAGVKLDCNLSANFTGAGCTNNDAAINGLLATATAVHPVTLIMDGGTVTSGLLIPSTGNVTIQCTGWDAGFVLISGSNAHMLNNVFAGDPYTWATTPGTPGQNVTIRDCRWNGNQPHAGTGPASWQGANGNWLGGLYLDNLTHVLIEHNWFYDIATYNIHFNAVTDGIVENNRLDAVAQGPHQDGVHVDGPSADIRVSHNWFNNSDDSMGFNATEGYGGPITGVIVDSNHCEGCLTAYRQLSNEFGGSAVNQQVSGVAVTNGSGWLRSSNGEACAAFRLGEQYSSGGGKTADIMQDISISNSAYTLTSADCVFVDVADNIGTLSLSNVHWLSPVGATSFLHFYSGSTISNFVCRACGIHRTTTGNAAAVFAVVPNFSGSIPSADIISRLDLDFAITNEQGQSYPALPYLIDVQAGSGIGTFVLNSLDPALSPTLLNGNEWSRIANFYGPGVSTYYRITTYANLPPATYPGLKASISDSNAGGAWGATEGGGSAGHYAEETSNGTNWTVTGK